MPTRDQYLATTEWLAANLTQPNLRVLECTVFLRPREDGKPGYAVVPGREEWAAGHIPGAGFAVRARVAEALAAGGPAAKLIFTAPDGVLAKLAAAEAGALALGGGTAAWRAAGGEITSRPIRWSTRARRSGA